MKQSVSQIIAHLIQQIDPAYEDAVLVQQTAWWLLEALTKKRKPALIALESIELSPEQEQQLQKWIHQLVDEQKPLQYILGSVPFADLDILVEPPILIPRPETEEWTLQLIDQLASVKDKPLTILDVGTGSGCITLALADALPQATVLGIDIDKKAIDLARRNAQHNHIPNVTFMESDVYNKLAPDAQFDLIVSNPPYIAPAEWQQLSPTVTKWEDKQALVANHEGLAVIERIIHGAQKHLKIDSVLNQHKLPRLVIEIGYQQGPTVKQIMEDAHFHPVSIKKDLEGKDRIVTARV